MAAMVALAARVQGQTTIAWNSATGGSWGTAADWTPNQVPNSSSYIASIALGGTYTVTLNTGETVDALEMNAAGATLSLTGTTLTLSGAAGASSTITAGTVTLNNSNLNGVAASGTYLVTNGGTLNAVGTSSSIIYGGTNGLTFTNNGTISVTAGALYLGYSANDVVNNTASGVITATNATLYLNGGATSINNAGTITAGTGGVINFGGNFTTADLGGTINGSAGTLNLTGNLTNTTLNAPSTGIWTLNGGTIIGGAVASGALTVGASGGTFDGVAFNGDLSLPSGHNFDADNGTTFAGGTVTLANNFIYLNGLLDTTALTVASGETLQGNITIEAMTIGQVLANYGTINNTGGGNFYYGNGGSLTLNNNAGGLITATGGSLNLGNSGSDTINNANGAVINADGGSIYVGYNGTTVNNAGTLEATAAGSALTLGSNWSTSGTSLILASNGGVVNLAGTFTNADLTTGTINGTGGTINITGTLDNTTLAAPNGGGIYTLYGGTIDGGTVPQGTLNFGTTTGVLEGVTLTGNNTLASGNSVAVEGGSVFSGGTTTITDGYLYLAGTAGSTALTIAAGATVTGNFYLQAQAAGLVVQNNGSLISSGGSNYYYGNGGSLTLDNNAGGVISATGGNLFLGDGTGDTFNNAGTINAAGGAIVAGNQGATVTNTGTVEATLAGSTLTLEGAWSSTGTILASNGGVVNLGGTFSDSNLTSGTINASGGTANITGTLNNTALAAPNGGGIFTLNGGTIVGGSVPQGALAFGPTAGTLDGVTLSGNFTLAAGYSVAAQGGSVFTGGTTTFTDGYLYLSGTAGSTALTVAAGAAVSGDFNIQAQAAGLVVQNNGSLISSGGSNYYYGNGGSLTLDNNTGATISATGGNLFLGDSTSDTFNNAGTINAAGGSIVAGNNGATVTNTGTLEATAAGSTLTLEGAWSSTGTILASNGGVINLGGTFSNSNLTSGTINAAGGTVNLTGTLNNTLLAAPNGGGVFTLDGGTIDGGTVPQGTLVFGATPGTLEGVTLTGNSTLASGYSVAVQGGTFFTGSIVTFTDGFLYLTGLAGSTALTVASNAEVTGDVSIQAQAAGLVLQNYGTFTNTTGSNYYYGNGGSLTFDNNAGATVSATGGNLFLGDSTNDTVNNAGTINADGGSIVVGNSGAHVVNSGTLEASASGSTLTLGSNSGGTWSNSGTIEALNGGIIEFAGNYATSDLSGNILGAGGSLYLAGTLNNTASTLVPPVSGIYTLYAGTINGGVVDTGALTFSNQGGTLNGVTMSGNVGFPATATAYLTVTNGTVFTGGTTTFGTAANYGNVTLSGAGLDLTLAPTETWTGSVSVGSSTAGATVVNQGTVDFTANTNYWYSNSSGMTLTNQGAINLTGSSTLVNLGYYPLDTVVNTTGGTVTVNAGTLNLGGNAGSWDNAGSMTATNGGTIIFDGHYTTPNFGGAFFGAGGTLDLAGTFTNTGFTFAAPATGVFTLDGATITGGTIASGALTFSNAGGTLSGVTLNGAFGLPNVSAQFAATNGTVFTGGTTSFATSGTLGTVYLTGAGTDLTLAPSATWTGSFNVTANTAGATVVNNGQVDFTANTNYFDSNGTGIVFTNNGAINVTGAGTVANLGYYAADQFTNAAAGTITVNAGTVTLGDYQGSWANNGTITATNGGTVNFAGTYTTAAFGGTINGAGGTLNLGGVFTNTGGTLVAPASGVYTLHGATITGGTIGSGALTFSNTGGTLSGVVMNGTFTLPSTSVSFAVTNNTIFQGLTTFASTANLATVFLTGAGQDLSINPTATWTGSFNITGNTAGAQVVNQGTLDFTANGNQITSNSSGTAISNSGSINVTGAATTLDLGYYALDSFTNGGSGVVTANAGTIFLGTSQGTWSNSGALVATNGGRIVFGGTYSTPDFGGIIDGAGGTLDLGGTFTNTGGTLAAPTTGVYTLSGATVTGGTIASGALTFSNAGGTLSGVTLNGTFALPAAAPAQFYANGGTTFTGGTTTFGTTGNLDTIFLNGAGTDLTVAASAIWTGNFSIQGTAAGSAFVNQGTINLEASTNQITGNNQGFTFTNSGALIVTGGTTFLGYYASDTFTQSANALLEASGSATFVYPGYNVATVTNLAGNTLTGGTWEAVGGATMGFYGTTNAIVTNDANLILSGPGSVIETRTGASNSWQTVEQTLTTNNGSLQVLGGRNFAATNGLTNNGTLVLGGGTFTAPTLTNGTGSTIAGTGTLATTGGGLTFGTGVTVSPGITTAGGYVGTLSLNPSGAVVLGGGGTLVFDVSNASGAAGTGYDTLAATGPASVTASAVTPFTVDLESINPGTGLPGLATFNSSSSYQWTLLSATSLSNFSAADFSLNTSSFTNSLGTGSFYFSSDGANLFLDFTPVPEPATWALIGGGLGALGLVAGRRRARARR